MNLTNEIPVEYYEEVITDLKTNIKLLQQDLAYAKDAALLLNDALRDAQSRLSSSDEQMEYFKRNIFCSILNNPKIEYPLLETAGKFNEYFTIDWGKK